MAIFMTLSGVFAALAGAMTMVRSSFSARPARNAPPRTAMPARLTAAQQWEKVSGVINAAIGSATQARELQASAAQQIDLATYALYTLVDDLAGVLSEPLVRESASVHRLAPKSRGVAPRALAA